MSYTQEQINKFAFHDFIVMYYDDIRCPSCRSNDWKSAIHLSPEFSIHCYECGREDSGDFVNHVKILKPWVSDNA